MKKIIVNIATLTYLSLGLLYSQNCDIDTLRYIQTFKYIELDCQFREMNSLHVDNETKCKTINVSTHIHDLDRFWLSCELNDFPIEQQLLKKYREKKMFVWAKPFYSNCLDKLFHTKHSYEECILFYSKIEDNILVANLLPVKKVRYDINDFENICSFTEGYYYLFIFNPDNSFKKILRRKMIYD